MGKFEDLTVKQLDDSLRTFGAERPHRTPPGGWVKTIRSALGMSIRQLAERAGLSRTSVASAERSEAASSVQLSTLQRLADALDCDVVYSLVPRTTLRDRLRKQARLKADRLVGRVSDTMELEAQGVSAHERQRQRDELIEELLRDRGRDFWDD